MRFLLIWIQENLAKQFCSLDPEDALLVLDRIFNAYILFEIQGK